jgi:hypothetical protein
MIGYCPNSERLRRCTQRPWRAGGLAQQRAATTKTPRRPSGAGGVRGASWSGSASVITTHALFARKVQRKLTNGVREGAGCWPPVRAAYPRHCSSNASGLHSGIRLGSGEPARAFKEIICDDISEFESHMPSHAVGSPPDRIQDSRSHLAPLPSRWEKPVARTPTRGCRRAHNERFSYTDHLMRGGRGGA